MHFALESMNRRTLVSAGAWLSRGLTGLSKASHSCLTALNAAADLDSLALADGGKATAGDEALERFSHLDRRELTGAEGRSSGACSIEGVSARQSVGLNYP